MKARFVKTLAFALAAGGTSSLAAAQSIVTLPPNNGSGGVFLQLTPAAGPLTVNSFASYFSSAAGTPVSVEVWVRPGAYAGFTASNAGWTLSETVVGTSAGAAVLSGNITLANPIPVPAGGPTSIYFHAITAGGGIRYQGTGATATTTFTNADVTLFTDVSRTGAVSFAGTQFTPRAFSGAINYSLGGTLGACCLTSGASNCVVTTLTSCTNQGGTYQGDNSNCGTANCAPLPTGQCCIQGTCQVLTQFQCTSQGGTYGGNNTNCTAACPQPPQGPGGVYAVNIREGNVMVNFPIASPAYNVVGTVGETVFAIDFNGDGSRLYGITDPDHELAIIGQTTGALGIIGTISGAGAAEPNWADLSFDASTGTMYAIAGANLYTVNLSTGATTLVAAITGGPAGALYIDGSINTAGTLFIAHDITTDQMVSINKATGAATILGPTGFLANFAQGMDFDPDTNDLYATIYTGGGTGAFCSVNTTTGTCTSLANTQPWTAAGPEFEMAIKGTAPVGCYADCDGIGGLTANDFICFLTSFNNGASYADCDGVGGLTANDFICFLTEYNNGCS